MDISDDGPDFLAGDRKTVAEPVTSVETPVNENLSIDIADAVSEGEKVRFTVHTKTTLPIFEKGEFSVSREHEEFIWLNEVIKENPEYAGYIIPPPPPRPDFYASREKLQKLGESEPVLSKDEFSKLKEELEAEYLATFKKVVAMHEVFLQRLGAHRVFCNDLNFKVFLTYNDQLNVRGKNKKEMVASFVKGLSKSVDEILLASQRDLDDYYEQAKSAQVEYHRRLKESIKYSERVTKSQRDLSEQFRKISGCFDDLAVIDDENLVGLNKQMAETFEKIRKLEKRVSTDSDLKMTDLLRYLSSETEAAMDLLFRRTKSLADYEAANKALDKARSKGKDITQAESNQQAACEKFELISDLGRTELQDVRRRKVQAFQKYLKEHTELMIKHSQSEIDVYKKAIESLRSI